MDKILTPHQNIVNMMARGMWKAADALVLSVAEASAQGDFDVVYGAAYATYLEQKSR
jgi:hypothetical protein